MLVLPRSRLARPVARCRSKFLHHFPQGFRDPTYLAWERGYKWDAHLRWKDELGENEFEKLLRGRKYSEIARRAVTIESRTNLLFSFEKMALRDAVKEPAGARGFATALYDVLYGTADLDARFNYWCNAIAALPRRQTRVLTWPLATVFPFLAQPRTHLFLKPMVMRRAAERYGQTLEYRPRPSADIYDGVLAFARTVKKDLSDLKPRDMIDIQSFLWVQGSDEYPD